MLVKQETSNITNYITFVKGELKLVLTESGFWKFAQDIKDTDNILEIKTFSFGDNIGIIKKENHKKTYIKIKNEIWYLVTLNNGNKPILKDTNPQCPDKVHPRYIELQEVI